MAKKSNKKRSDGRIAVQVYLGVVDGKRKYKTVYGANQKEADTKAQELKEKLNKGIDLLTSDKSFEFWANRWLNVISKEKSVPQYQAYKSRTEFFVDRIGSRDIAKIKLYELQEIIDTLSDCNPTTGHPSAKKTVNNYIFTLRQIFSYAIDNRVIEYNPAVNLKVNQNATQTKRRALTREERQWVIDTEHRAQLPAMLAMLAGLRRGEIAALQWSDIDFEKKTISITKSYSCKLSNIKSPKTESGNRIVTMPEILSDFLQEQPKKGIYVFTTQNGNIMREGAWERLWKSYMKTLNEKYGNFEKVIYRGKEKPFIIEPFTLHYLRHTYASILYEAGVDVLTAKELMGHSDIKTTLGIYTHLSREHKEKDITKLNDFLKCKSDASQYNA